MDLIERSPGDGFRMEHGPTKHRIIVRLLGAGVSPESVRARDLADFIAHFEKAIEQAESRVTPRAAVLDDLTPIVSLVKVARGSNELQFAVADSALPSAVLVGTVLSTRDFSAISFGAHRALHEMSQQAVSRSWAVEVVADPAIGLPGSVFSSVNPIPAPRVALASGHTTLYGMLIRVGGMTPRAMILLADRSVVYVDLDEAQAIEISIKGGLYASVGVEGRATWRLDTWAVVEFKAERITPYGRERADLVQVFQKLAEAADGRWDDVDPIEYVRELRGGDDE